MESLRESLSTVLSKRDFPLYESNMATVAKDNQKLLEDKPPVFYGHGPLPLYVLSGQIDHLQCSVIVRENGLRLGKLPDAAVEALDDVGGVDDVPDFRWELQEHDQFRPVRAPAFDGIGILSAPLKQGLSTKERCRSSQAVLADGLRLRPLAAVFRLQPVVSCKPSISKQAKLL